MQASLTAIYSIVPRFGAFKVVDTFSLPFPILLPQSIEALPHRAIGLSLNGRFGNIFIRVDLNV